TGALSADRGRARHRRRDLEKPVRKSFTAGCDRNASRPSRPDLWRTEADMTFVSPDESGRVTKLNVREGDEVKTGMALYSVDDDLQRADLNQNNATLANAK